MWTTKMIETDRGIFEVFEKGAGDPLAVTHFYSAFNEQGSIFADYFTPYHKVILINLREAGRSPAAELEEQLSMEETVLDLEAIREAYGYEKWGFAGHSTGGMLALQYAYLAPKALTKIICGGAAASNEYGQDPDSIYNHKNPHNERITEIMGLLNNSETPVEVRKKVSYEWAVMSYQSEEKLKNSIMKPNSGKNVGKRLIYFNKHIYPTMDYRPFLKDIQVPSFIYVGRYDSQCPAKHGIEIANLIPTAKLTVFENSNHFPFNEEEDKFEAYVRETICG